MMPHTIDEAAQEEFIKATEWYEARSDSLAGAFRVAFKEALIRIRENPLMYAAEDDTQERYCPVGGYPYLIVYVSLEDHIWVAALTHHSRRPRYWARRRPT